MARTRYDTDLTDEEWQLLRPWIPAGKAGGRPRSTNMREVMNALFYLTRSGCQWRLLPHDFPPWPTVWTFFRVWRKDGTWQNIHDFFRRKLRLEEGRAGQPSAAIIDSQTVKTTEQGGKRGYDAGKKINGRKRHILVDTLGLLICVVVHSADLQERDGAREVLKDLPAMTRLRLIWADGAYAGQLVAWVKKNSDGSLRSSSDPTT